MAGELSFQQPIVTHQQNLQCSACEETPSYPGDCTKSVNLCVTIPQPGEKPVIISNPLSYAHGKMISKGGGGACSCSWTPHCHIRLGMVQTQQTCPKGLDGKKICTLVVPTNKGIFASGNCTGNTCEFEKNWENQCILPIKSCNTKGNGKVGWVNCQYIFDYENYNTVGEPPSINSLSMFLSGLYNGYPGIEKAVQLPEKLRTWSVKSNILRAILVDSYNQMYNTGYYKKNLTPTVFSGIDYFDKFSFNTFASESVGKLNEVFSLIYKDNPPPQLITSLIDLIVLPIPFQTKDTYSITFSLSWPLFEMLFESTDPDGLISLFMNNILRDSKGSISKGSNTTIPNGCSLANITYITDNTVSAMKLDDYTIHSGIHYGNFGDTNYPGDQWQFATAQVTCDVVTWSPMLLIYFGVFLPSVSYSTNMCTKINSQTNLLPQQCYLDCANNQNTTCVKNYLENYCEVSYSPPNYLIGIDPGDFIMSSSGDSCQCFVSKLAPPNQIVPENKAAMCFTTYCDQNKDILTDYGLTNDVCKTYCDTVWGWLNNPNPGNQSLEPKLMDWNRFKTICGNSFKPQLSSKYNKKILVLGSTSVLLLSFLIFSIGKHLKYSGVKIGVMIALLVILLGGATGFFTKDFAGLGYCDKGKFICKSKITKMKIPSDFCNESIDCECDTDSNCPSGCICATNVCLPKTGNRPTKKINKNRVDMINIIVSGIIGIVVPMVLIFLHDDYHWGINKYVFSGIVIFLGLGVISYALYDSFRKRPKIVFASSCKPSPPKIWDCADDICYVNQQREGDDCTSYGNTICQKYSCNNKGENTSYCMTQDNFNNMKDNCDSVEPQAPCCSQTDKCSPMRGI